MLFPTVILLSAVATLTGAGAHLITDQLVTAATGDGIGSGRWLLLGLPFAVVSSHVAAEVVLAVMCRRADRRTALCLDRAEVVIAPSGFKESLDAAALAAATRGGLVPVTVTGPVGEPVTAHFAILGGRGPRTAVVEMAAAARAAPGPH